MVKIPAGEFIMGSNKVDKNNSWKQYGSREPWFLNEHPEHKKYLPEFYIDVYEVTNAQYRDYILQSQRSVPDYWLANGYAFSLKQSQVQQMDVAMLRMLSSEVFKFDVDAALLSREDLLEIIERRWQAFDNLPVTHVTWFEARDYCQWYNKQLPSEAQWEKAARGNNGAEFVFGQQWKPGLSNVGEEHWPFGVAPVGAYPKDRSVFGVYDLAGNAYEWVSDWYQSYEGSDYHGEYFGKQFKVVRGSGFGSNGHYFLIHYQRAAYRGFLYPDDKKSGQGFRCVKAGK